MEDGPLLQPSYCGQCQPRHIVVPDTIYYRYYNYNPEESCWAMPPYASIYPPPPPPQWPETPLSLWNRMQIFQGSQWGETTHNQW
jgi:hypothetical protein